MKSFELKQPEPPSEIGETETVDNTQQRDRDRGQAEPAPAPQPKGIFAINLKEMMQSHQLEELPAPIGDTETVVETPSRDRSGSGGTTITLTSDGAIPSGTIVSQPGHGSQSFKLGMIADSGVVAPARGDTEAAAVPRTRGGSSSSSTSGSTASVRTSPFNLGPGRGIFRLAVAEVYTQQYRMPGETTSTSQDGNSDLISSRLTSYNMTDNMNNVYLKFDRSSNLYGNITVALDGMPQGNLTFLTPSQSNLAIISNLISGGSELPVQLRSFNGEGKSYIFNFTLINFDNVYYLIATFKSCTQYYLLGFPSGSYFIYTIGNSSPQEVQCTSATTTQRHNVHHRTSFGMPSLSSLLAGRSTSHGRKRRSVINYLRASNFKQLSDNIKTVAGSTNITHYKITSYKVTLASSSSSSQGNAPERSFTELAPDRTRSRGGENNILARQEPNTETRELMEMDGDVFEVFTSCELRDLMDGNRDEFILLDPDGSENVFMAECSYDAVTDRIATKMNVQPSGFIVDTGRSTYHGDITYSTNGNTVSHDQLAALIDNSGTCTQRIIFICQGATIGEDGSNGVLLGRDGIEIESPWSGTDGTCQNPALCGCRTAGQNGMNEALISDRHLLPLTGFRLESVDGPGSFHVGPLECTNDDSYRAHVVKGEILSLTAPLRRSCYELKQHFGAAWEPGYYEINPNPSSGRTATVYCETDGVTLIRHDQMGVNAVDAGSSEIEPMYYATDRFMADLAEISREVQQYVKATCKNMPFFGETGEALASWTTLDEVDSTRWGNPSLPGCPCSQRDSGCNQQKLCNCDAVPGHETLDEIFLPEPAKRFSFQQVEGQGNTLELGGVEFIGSRLISGRQAEAFYVPVQLSCGDVLAYLEYNGRVAYSGYYYIDPDGPTGSLPPFFAFCDFYYDEVGTEIRQVAETVIHHDDEGLLYADEEGFTQRFSYDGVSMEQISALAQISEKCEQEIEFNCKSSPMWDGEEPRAWWTNRYGARMSNWGGVPTGEEGCACMLTDGCEEAAARCNCDANSTTSDGGVLTDKNLLPVTSVTFGSSTGGTSSFWVSELWCSGQGGLTAPAAEDYTFVFNAADQDYRLMNVLPRLDPHQEWIEFTVNAPSDAYIAFTSDPLDTPEYEIAIGASGNTRTNFYESDQDEIKFDTPGVLNTDGPTRFRIGLADGTFELLKVENGGETPVAAVSFENVQPFSYIVFGSAPGSPSEWTFHTGTGTNVCDSEVMSLTCPGGQFLDVLYASYGYQPGVTSCGGDILNYEGCHSENSFPEVLQRCQGRSSCMFQVSAGVFNDPCPGTPKSLTIRYQCIDESVVKTGRTGACLGLECMNGGYCILSNGAPLCRCPSGWAGPTCEQSGSMCMHYGGAHFVTFDGKHYEFSMDENEECTFILVRHEGSTGESFDVLMRNGDVYIEINSERVTLGEDVRINDFPVSIDVTTPLYSISHQGNGEFAVDLNVGMTVVYKKGSALHITMDGDAAALSGLCGNNDGDENNDFELENDEITAVAQEFVQQHVRDCPTLTEIPCTMDVAVAREQCRQYFDDSLFAACTAFEAMDIFLNDCSYDVCRSRGHCSSLEAYVDRCMMRGISLPEWRNAIGCDMGCGPNMVYEECASACPATCQNPEAPTICTLPCVERCVCVSGFVLSAGRCVPAIECRSSVPSQSFTLFPPAQQPGSAPSSPGTNPAPSPVPSPAPSPISPILAGQTFDLSRMFRNLQVQSGSSSPPAQPAPAPAPAPAPSPGQPSPTSAPGQPAPTPTIGEPAPAPPSAPANSGFPNLHQLFQLGGGQTQPSPSPQGQPAPGPAPSPQGQPTPSPQGQPGPGPAPSPSPQGQPAPSPQGQPGPGPTPSPQGQPAPSPQSQPVAGPGPETGNTEPQEVRERCDNIYGFDVFARPNYDSDDKTVIFYGDPLQCHGNNGSMNYMVRQLEPFHVRFYRSIGGNRLLLVGSQTVMPSSLNGTETLSMPFRRGDFLAVSFQTGVISYTKDGPTSFETLVLDYNRLPEIASSLPGTTAFITERELQEKREYSIMTTLDCSCEGEPQGPTIACDDPLGMESGAIPDASITASSAIEGSPASEGRLYSQQGMIFSGSEGWTAATSDSGQWIQVKLNDVTDVVGLQTQGGGQGASQEWVTSYAVQYGIGSETPQYFRDDRDIIQTFVGNSDKDSIYTNYFWKPVKADVIRIMPKSWNFRISMRFEVLGCRFDDPCDSNPCQNGGICSQDIRNNDYVCACPERFTGKMCEEEIGTCILYPTSSIRTYDDRMYYFPGECEYVATKTCEDGNDDSFQVFVHNVPSTAPSSYVPIKREIRVELDGKSYELKGEREFYIDGERVSLPYIRPNIQVILAGNNFPVLKTSFGLRVWWNGQRTVKIEIPNHLRDQMCGLCGNFNSDQTDDFRMPDQTLVASAPAFGFSWSTTEQCTTRCPFCLQPPSCGDSSAQELSTAQMMCAEMNIPFAACLAAMPGNTYMSECVLDMCETQDDGLFCEILANLAMECEASDVSVGRWRDAIERCAPTPPPGTMYEPCLVPCMPTCADPGSAEKCDLMTCVEGYACSPGLVFNGETCVAEMECGCLVEGKSYDIGESYLVNDCSEQCVCGQGGNMECRPVECNDDATCAVRDSGLECNCNEGFSGNGLDNCYPINQPTETAVCEDEDITLTCESGVIDVLTAYYGQDGRLAACQTSGFFLGSCSAEGALLAVQVRCQGQASCTFTANSDVFGEPCGGVAKYVRVEHHCTPEPLASEVPQAPVRRNTPQDRTMTLQCPEGTFMDVQHVRFGRPDLGESCFSASAEVLVTMACQGQTQCEVDATVDNLGETCDPANNVLEVTFECSEQPMDRTNVLGHPCNFQPCVNGACIATNTPDGFQCCCDEGFTGPLCDREEGECRVFGGSQVMTFDGNQYQFHGDCLYTLFEDCSAMESGRVPIEVSVRGQVYKFVRSISFIREVHVKLGTREVILGRDSLHEVDGYEVEAPFTVSTGQAMLTVRQAGNTMVVTTSDGVVVEWNGKGQLSIRIPRGFYDTCGLCGDFDGDASNDFKDKARQQLTDTTALARAWAHNTRDCTICNGCQNIPACTRRPLYRAQANAICSILKNETGPFADCFDKVDPEPYYLACMEDQCALQPKQDLKCAHYEAYVDACQARRVQLAGWRDEIGCSYMCPLGKVYTSCTEGLSKHCGITDIEATCSKRCYEACECPQGRVMSSRDMCVLPEECGCLNQHGIDTYYVPAGTTFTRYGCNRECTCEKGGTTSCTAYACHEHATCMAGDDKVYGCHCKSGYSGNGHLCHVEVLEYPRMRAVVTEGQVMNLDCGDYMLDILDVGYGSLETMCEGDDADPLCDSYSAYSMALGICQGYERCRIPACDRLFGDPCFTKRHYLSVYYTCSHNPVVKHPKMPFKKIICQNNPVVLNCKGGHINVLSASYGRSTGRDICAADNIGDQSCHEPTSLGVVMSQCQGHGKCEIWANDEFFPDPCPDTFKYLEVEYECLGTKLLYFNAF